jgi:mannonate dehydratase
MQKITRRQTIAGAAASFAATANAKAAARRTPIQGKPGLRLAMMMGSKIDHKCRVARQIGVNHAICGVTRALAEAPRSQYEKVLTGIRDEFREAGFTISAVESHPVPAEKIKLGIDGRDEEIENYIAAIHALAKIGVPVICYNFMAGLGWYRTRVNAPGRGGALITEFDNAAAKAQGLTQWGAIPEEKIWKNIEYFLKAVIPEAEKANVKMALHPDDPPLSPLRGIGRIVTSAANYRKIMNLVPSPVNGVTYCQANFVAMGEDIEALAKEWLKQKKIFFVHFRDIEGSAEHFRETFHDNGSTDMARMLKVYHDGGFEGAMRPDHAPTLDEETNDRPGYAIQGKIYAIGYMRGLLEGQKIPHL